MLSKMQAEKPADKDATDAAPIRSSQTPQTMFGVRKGPLAPHELKGTQGYSMVNYWKGGRPS